MSYSFIPVCSLCCTPVLNCVCNDLHITGILPVPAQPTPLAEPGREPAADTPTTPAAGSKLISGEHAAINAAAQKISPDSLTISSPRKGQA